MKRPDQAALDETAARWIARRDAGLSSAEAAEFAAWRDASEAHAAALARFEQTWSAVSRPRALGASAALSGEIRQLERRQRRRRNTAAAALAVVLVLVSVTFFRRPGAAPGPEFPASAMLVTAERRTLPDGSIAELRPGAEFTVDFSAAVRRVRLTRGEALFQVTKNRARPFVVEAAGVEVRAVGTAFAVQLNEGEIEVLVTEGRVAVEKPAATAAAPAAVTLAFVDAGNRVSVDAGPSARSAGPVTPVSSKELDERLSWRAPRVEFSGTPLADVIEVINRYAAERQHPRFVIAEPELGQVKLSGLFRVDDTAGLVQMFETNFGLKAESRGENDIVLRRRR
jgi:transmembrane sensor